MCHFDPETGTDLRRGPRARELLLRLTRAGVEVSPAALPRAEHLTGLKRQCHSDLERQWLAFLEGRGLRLPSKSQVFIEACHTRPDFLYEDCQTAVYIDGPHHAYPERQERDKAQTECLEDLGYVVIRFGHHDTWDAIINQHPNIFGRTT